MFTHYDVRLVTDGDCFVISQTIGNPDDHCDRVEIRVHRDQCEAFARFILSEVNKNAPGKPQASAQQRFEEFWALYPRKEAKAASRAIWNRRRYDQFFQQISAHVEWMRGSDQWKDGFIPMPSTYLNQRRWEDMEEVETFEGFE